jgi:hypothetical protein
MLVMTALFLCITGKCHLRNLPPLAELATNYDAVLTTCAVCLLWQLGNEVNHPSMANHHNRGKGYT